MRRHSSVSVLLAILLAGGVAVAQEASPGKDYVTREEYEKLKSQLDKVVQQLDQVQKEQKQAVTQADVDKVVEDIQRDIKENRNLVNEIHQGFNKVLIAGDGAFGFTAQHGSTTTFDAGIAPLILWELNDRLLVEMALDISTSNSTDANTGDPTHDTTIDLVLANISYLVNDNLYVGGGLFAVPFGRYHPHFDPSWINRFPDDPLVFGDRSLAPGSEVGIFAGGAVPIGSTKINYNAYVTNGPNLVVSNTDPDAGPVAGNLDFTDYTDLNENKAVGGRIGFQPIPELEIGYSIQYSQPNPAGFQEVRALLQAVDAQYRRQIDAIRGTIDLRAEWIWSNVSEATYTLQNTPMTFGSDRNGGYLQASYRPSQVENKFLRSLEFLVRYDRIHEPTLVLADGTKLGGNEGRLGFAIDYWLTPNVVLKLAYEFDDKDFGDNANAFFAQCGFGL